MPLLSRPGLAGRISPGREPPGRLSHSRRGPYCTASVPACRSHTPPIQWCHCPHRWGRGGQNRGHPGNCGVPAPSPRIPPLQPPSLSQPRLFLHSVGPPHPSLLSAFGPVITELTHACGVHTRARTHTHTPRTLTATHPALARTHPSPEHARTPTPRHRHLPVPAPLNVPPTPAPLGGPASASRSKKAPTHRPPPSWVAHSHINPSPPTSPGSLCFRFRALNPTSFQERHTHTHSPSTGSSYSLFCVKMDWRPLTAVPFPSRGLGPRVSSMGGGGRVFLGAPCLLPVLPLPFELSPPPPH